MVETATIVEIEQLYARYGHVMDDQDWERLPDVFLPEIVFDATALGVPLMEGFEKIVEISTTSPAQPLGHHVTNVYVERVDGDEATVRAKALGAYSKGRVFSGEYVDTLSRTPAGWRIRHRVNRPAT